MVICQNIAALISTAKEARGCTQSAFAESLGVSRWKLRRFLQASWKVNIEDISLLSSGLVVDSANLICSFSEDAGRDIITLLLHIHSLLRPVPRRNKKQVAANIICVLRSGNRHPENDNIALSLDVPHRGEILMAIFRIRSLLCHFSLNQQKWFVAQLIELVAEDLNIGTTTILDMASYRIPLRVTEYVRRYSVLYGYTCYPVCPRCKSVFKGDYQSFCDRCGQALLW